jgi:hypothetical protein
MGISCWVSLLNAKTFKLVPSSLTCALFASSSLGLLIAELSLLCIGLSSLDRLVCRYIRQDWHLATASLLCLFFSRFGLSAFNVEREEPSKMQLANGFLARPGQALTHGMNFS